MTSIAARHREALVALVRSTPEFTLDEVTVALELADASIKGSTDYRCLVDEEGDRLRGYICFGPTPMTDGTWDLYWIAVSARDRQKGVGRVLIGRMMEEVRRASGRLVRVETSGQAGYEATRAFYEHSGFETVARIRDFYRPGDDLVVYGKYL
jgi:ribosomal protein S18 acetylase RimI-like enzyme